MNPELDNAIAAALDEARELIEADKTDQAMVLLGELINTHPEMADARFKAELGLLERLIYCRKTLKESEYARSFELVSRYCRATYGDGDHLKYPKLPDKDLPDRDKIWWFWNQGVDAAPAIVRACLESLKKLNRKIIVLDERNISEYADIPGHFMDTSWTCADRERFP